MSDEEKYTDIQESINEIKLWQAEHDGRINAWWVTQHKWNVDHEQDDHITHQRIEKNVMKIDHRMSSVEKKIFLIAGFAAGIGGVIGQLIHSFATGAG